LSRLFFSLLTPLDTFPTKYNLVKNNGSEKLADYLLRGSTTDGHFRFFAVDGRETVQTAIDIHYLSIVNSVAFGRLLIAGLLMATSLKNPDDLLTVRIDGDGPSGVLLVSANGDGTIRGYVQNPQVELPMTERGFAVADAIGKGTLSVIRSVADSPPYTSQTRLTTSEIGDDICAYFLQSEQIQTVVNLGILISPQAEVLQAGGLFIQCLPDTPFSLIESMYERVNRVPNLSDLMDMGISLSDILARYIFTGVEFKVSERSEVAYKCHCDRQRFYRGLMLLSTDERRELFRDDDSITAQCHFCGKKYEFSSEELGVRS